MVIEISVQLLYGFKVSMADAFKHNLLKSDILDGDDWQLCDDKEVVKQNVISPLFLELLENDTWNIYIQTSTQNEPDIEKSYLFIYNRKEDLCYGISDYKIGQVDMDIQYPADVHNYLNKLIDEYSWNYQIHWIIERSF